MTPGPKPGIRHCASFQERDHPAPDAARPAGAPCETTMTPAHGLPFRCVIFDLDGTLLDTRAAMLSTLNALLVESGRSPVTEDRIGHALHLGLPSMLRAALADAPLPPTQHADVESRLLQRYRAGAARSVATYPGATALLDALRGHGAWLAVCSNQDQASVRSLLAGAGLLGHFRGVVGGDTLPTCKPDPAPLRWLLEAAAIPASQTIMVGDSELDAECARRCGMAAVIMAHGYGGPGILAPHRRMRDFAELATLLFPTAAPAIPASAPPPGA